MKVRRIVHMLLTKCAGVARTGQDVFGECTDATFQLVVRPKMKLTPKMLEDIRVVEAGSWAWLASGLVPEVAVEVLALLQPLLLKQACPNLRSLPMGIGT